MNFNKVISIVVALSLMFCVSACQDGVDSSKGEQSSKIVGTVGDEKIFADELKFYFNWNRIRTEDDAGIANKNDEEKSKFWEENKDKTQELIDKTFDDIKHLKILLILAEQEKVELEQAYFDEVESNIEQFIKEKANNDKEEAEKLMKEMYGVSIDEYRDIYLDFLIAYDKYTNRAIDNIEISDSDIEKRFDADKEQYKKVNVKHILFYTIDTASYQPLAEEKIEQKKNLAEEIFKRVKEGEDFDDLAKQYSEDLNSKDSGGEYTLSKGETVKEYEEWAFNAKEGDVGFVETSYGFNIIKFIKDVEASLGDREKGNIIKELKNEQFSNKVEEIKGNYPLVKNQEIIDSIDLF
mgnify:CR=1 FL=1